MNLKKKLAFASLGLYNQISPRERMKAMKAMSNKEARKVYLPVIMGEIARCDTSIEIICEDIAEDGVSLENWMILKHYIGERNIFVQALED